MTSALQPAYFAPRTVAEALALIADPAGSPVIVGGGTVVYPRLCDDSLRATRIVDVASVRDLVRIDAHADHVRVGPLVTYAMLIDGAPGLVPPLLRRIAGGITGGPQIRNQGTVGGSACHANPTSEIPTALVALDATLILAGQRGGERRVRASAFFERAFETARAADELLVDIAIPWDVAGARWGYHKLKTSDGSWAIAVAAARVRPEADGTASLELTLGAATESPVKVVALRLEHVRALQPADALRIREAVRAAPAVWWTDGFADTAYRSRVAEVVAVRAVEDALTVEHPDA